MTRAVNVLERSRAWIRQNPEEAQRIVASSLNLDAKVIGWVAGELRELVVKVATPKASMVPVPI